MFLRIPRLPIRAWSALTSAALVLALGVLVWVETRPEWRRHQMESLRKERAAAERALASAEGSLHTGRARAQVDVLIASLQAAEREFAGVRETDAYTRATSDLREADRNLARVQNDLQRARAEYQRTERDYLLARRDEDRTRLRAALEGAQSGVDTLARDRDRFALAREDAGKRLRAFTAKIDAARDALARFGEAAARARSELAAVDDRRPGIQQLVLDDLARVDRCTTCHVAAVRSAAVQTGAGPGHRGRYVQHHQPEKFGCTTCHGGQGRATTVATAHGRVAHWRTPLVTDDLMGGRCAVCHRGETVPGEPYATAGRRLFLDAGCHGCHEIEGVSAEGIGPSLAGVGSKVQPAWLASWLRDPRAYLPRTRMPNFTLADQEVADLSAFLLSLAASPDVARGGWPPGRVEHGELLFKESRCVTCHALRGRGGTLGPDLGRVAGKVREGWLAEFLAAPARVLPGTKMPQYRFTPGQVADLVAYIRSEFVDFEGDDTASAAAPAGRVAEGFKLVRKYGCFGCHHIPGFEQAGRVGAELTGFADKPVDRLDFGLRHDVERTWLAWTEAKLREPRGFRAGLKMPDFGFSSYERYALLTFLASLVEELPAPGFLAEVPQGTRYEPEGRFGDLVAELKCLVCHSIRGRGGSLAPDLTREGSRVRPEWLRRFLDQPNTIRLHLEERMPRFRLARGEVETIVGYVENVLVDSAVPRRVFADGAIDASLIARGRTLYYDIYACQACHQLGLDGGAVGPDLTSAGDRLTEGWIYAWLRDSRRLDPTAREPVYALPDEEARAITAWLLSGGTARHATTPARP